MINSEGLSKSVFYVRGMPPTSEFTTGTPPSSRETQHLIKQSMEHPSEGHSVTEAQAWYTGGLQFTMKAEEIAAFLLSAPDNSLVLTTD